MVQSSLSFTVDSDHLLSLLPATCVLLKHRRSGNSTQYLFISFLVTSSHSLNTLVITFLYSTHPLFLIRKFNIHINHLFNTLVSWVLELILRLAYYFPPQGHIFLVISEMLLIIYKVSVSNKNYPVTTFHFSYYSIILIQKVLKVLETSNPIYHNNFSLNMPFMFSLSSLHNLGDKAHH